MRIKKDEHQNCAILGYYAASRVKSRPTFLENLSAPSSGFKNPNTYFGFLNPEDGSDRVFRNVGNELPQTSAYFRRKAQFPTTSRRKPEISHKTRNVFTALLST